MWKNRSSVPDIFAIKKSTVVKNLVHCW